MTLSIIKTYSSDNIDVLNEKLWRDIYYDGNPLVFGSENEPKAAREVFAVIQLYGKALDDLYTGKLPKGWKFGEAANKIYIEMLKNPDKGEQPYTYGQRLHKYPADYHFDGINTYDQIRSCMVVLRRSIRENIQTNRICGVIWNPDDINLKDPPCFNWFQLRLSECNKVSLRVLFRSHDYGNANFANFGAIIRCFVDEVIGPAGGVLEELICVSTSAHLYENDSDMIEAVVGNIPEHIRRLLK